jgi:pimeloyl-ACP methyl ester carboxylesterase
MFRHGTSPAMNIVPLPAALDGERIEFSGAAGGLSAYVDGRGPPLLLVHSINAAASAAEMRPLYEHFRQNRTVVALDLPGYGFSERSDRVYTPRLMTDAIHATCSQIETRYGAGPVDALALSLSCEFLARAAVETPGAFRSIALVSPTGFGGSRPRNGPAGSTLAKPWVYRLLRGPGWGRGIYDALTRPGVVRYFLRRTWGADDIDEGLWHYDLITARQSGAEFAPLYFLSGGLFSADIYSIYGRLTLPVWVSHGVRGDFTDYHRLDKVAAHANWRVTVYETGALPHFEIPARFCADYAAFLAHSTPAFKTGDSHT